MRAGRARLRVIQEHGDVLYEGCCARHVSPYDRHVSQRAEQKAESRGAILRAAAGLLREKGISGTSVERAMAGAGLTVGAFYAHFAGKDELVEESFTLALDEVGEVMRASAAGRTGRAALFEVSNVYLSEGHRDKAKRGCPMPAVAGSSLPLGKRPLHGLVARGLATMAERLERIGAGEISSERALALAVMMVGGQMLARATRGLPMSSRVLLACRDAAKSLLDSNHR